MDLAEIRCSLAALQDLMQWWTRRQLNSRDPVRRKAALAKMAQRADSAMDGLAADALNDPDSEVRLEAIKAIARSKSDQALASLVSGLGHGDPSVREQCALALAHFSKERAVPPLCRALWDSHAVVRAAATRSLDALQWHPESDRDAAAMAAGRNKLAQAAQCGAAGVEALLAALADVTYPNRRAAIAALSETGDARAVKPLIQAARDADLTVRLAAVEALGDLNDPGTGPVLRAALADTDWHVRGAAAEALGRMEDVGSVDHLLKALNDPHWEVRKSTIEALVRISDGRAVPGLVERLRDTDYDVRSAATEALGQLKAVQAIEPLVGALIDEHGPVRRAAETALQRIDPKWEQSQPAQAAAAQLKAALKSNDYWVRQAASDARTKIGAAQAASPIPGNLAHVSLHNRQSAVDIFIECLEIEDRDLRLAAVEALGNLGEARAQPCLKAAATDPDEDVWVRTAAEAALPRLVRVRGAPLVLALTPPDSGTIVPLEVWREDSRRVSN